MQKYGNFPIYRYNPSFLPMLFAHIQLTLLCTFKTNKSKNLDSIISVIKQLKFPDQREYTIIIIHNIMSHHRRKVGTLSREHASLQHDMILLL